MFTESQHSGASGALEAEGVWDLTTAAVFHLGRLFGTGPGQIGNGFAVIIIGSFFHFPGGRGKERRETEKEGENELSRHKTKPQMALWK